MKHIIWLAIWAGMILSCGDPGSDYTQIHRSALVADTHSDTPLRMVRGFDISERDTTGHMDIPRLQDRD